MNAMTAAWETEADFAPGSEAAGSRSLQFSNRVGRIHKELVGRGPTRVRTHLGEDLVICILEGGFTQAERTVQQQAGEQTVMQNRLHLQDAMKTRIIAAAEEMLGRRVRSFMSANDPAHGL